jgi:putative aldouronate transport system permease protein
MDVPTLPWSAADDAGRVSKMKSSRNFTRMLKRDFTMYRSLYLLAIPSLAYFILFHYGPIYGAIIAFKDFTPKLGILRSPWVGFEHFVDFFNSFYFFRLLRNTLVLNVVSLLFEFPAPIILALLLNEVRHRKFKSSIQTLSYLPHFISIIVICGMILQFTNSRGIVSDFIALLGGDRVNLLGDPRYFRPVYVITEIWQGVGWGSIIYLAALSAIDQELYASASIDGAGRFRQAWHVTVPGILPTIVILLILRMGNMMSIGFEKIFLLYNPVIYETADVIPTFVYRRGLLENDYSFSAAVGIFNSVINLGLLVAANAVSRKVNETSLW